MKKVIRIAIPLLIIALGWASMKALSTKEEPRRSQRRGGNLPKVRVAELSRTDFQVTITSQGLVRAHNSTTITPRVSGRIETIHPKFEEGAFFREGDILVELDSTDFKAAIASADARVARAEAALAQEEARARQALDDWKVLNLEGEPGPLVLREPQLKEARANLAAAQAEQSAAQRDLERSKVLAPYDGCVLRRLTGPGQSVSPGTSLGEIFSTDFAEIRLPLAADDLAFFRMPEDVPENPVQTTIFDALTSENSTTWKGTIMRSEGALDDDSRKLFVIARVEDPYGLKSDHPPLRVGQPVTAEIEGTVLEDVFVIPREGLRNPTEVLLVNPEEHTLARTEISPIWGDENSVVVRDDLPEGWLLVVSQLSYAANGTKVEILPDEPEEDDLEDLKAAQRPGKKSPDTQNSGA